MTELLEAIALEDEDVLDKIGEEADPPGDTGAGVAAVDVEPPAGEADGAGEGDAAGAPDAAGSWRSATSLIGLRAQIDARWPNRDRRTDGTIGDVRHCGGGHTSDHCPNHLGVVRALDIDADGIPTAALAEHIRRRGAAGDKRLANGGYVIYNRRIASWSHGWTWRAYTGDSPHTDHIHVSCSLDASGYDAGGSWNLKEIKGGGGGGHNGTPLPKHAFGSRVLKLVDPCIRGTDVAFVQRWVGADDDGVFGAKTEKRVRRFQRIVDLEPNGIVDANVWLAMRVS
jgi:hypothetical protein